MWGMDWVKIKGQASAREKKLSREVLKHWKTEPKFKASDEVKRGATPCGGGKRKGTRYHDIIKGGRFTGGTSRPEAGGKATGELYTTDNKQKEGLRDRQRKSG